ncbi:hypothetical protein MMA231_04005 (plasmid) [Asticcacaulis sp. MM231]|uniref:antitoxin Xre/MbcA/ParS-like domain-containing protein n=1 Tax=Asticcacaulis sp. MM231 TaxID=3157666 RepID=UPI0032D57153
MATAEAITFTAKDARRADRIADELQPTLKAKLGPQAATLTANVAGIVAVMVEENASLYGNLIQRSQPDLVLVVKTLLNSMIHTKPAEIAKGEGLGELVSVSEGKAKLHAYAKDIPLEVWAGKMAGTTELQETFGISRSTLYDWQQAGHVISFLKGVKKHVFPVAQFMDRRPVAGLAEITKIAGGQRIAWLWLIEPCPELKGKKPLDVLKTDESVKVIEAARTIFESQ